MSCRVERRMVPCLPTLAYRVPPCGSTAAERSTKATFACRPVVAQGAVLERSHRIHLMPRAFGLAVLLLAAACSDAPSSSPRTANLSPVNPFLADSAYAIAHADAGQSDSSRVRGPLGPSAVLAPGDIAYRALGPGHFGAAISSPYPDGRRVVWSNGRENIVKLD